MFTAIARDETAPGSPVWSWMFRRAKRLRTFSLP